MTSATIERPATAKRTSVKTDNDAKAKLAKVAKRPSPVTVKAPKVAPKVAKVATTPKVAPKVVKTAKVASTFTYANVIAERGKTLYAATTGRPRRTYVVQQVGKADAPSFSIVAVYDESGKSVKVDKGLLTDHAGLASAGKAIAGWTVNVGRFWNAVGDATLPQNAPKAPTERKSTGTRTPKVKTREAFPFARGSKSHRQCFACMDSYPVADFAKFTDKDGVIQRCPKVAKHTRSAILESMQ